MKVDPFAVDDLDQFAARRLDDATPEGRIEFMQSEEYTLAYNEVLALGGDGIDTPTGAPRNRPRSASSGPTMDVPAWARRRGYTTRLQHRGGQRAQHRGGECQAVCAGELAMADAGLTSWNNKYDDSFWRPIMGIRKGDLNENRRQKVSPIGRRWGRRPAIPGRAKSSFTPPFPAYTSGHATFGAVTFQIVMRFYGRDDISFTFVSDDSTA